MPYDEGLAERIRGILEDDPRIREKKMFGGLAFLVDGNMSVGIIRDELMARVGPEAFEEALSRPHARAMDFTGRPMRGFVQVGPEGFEEDAELAEWIGLAVAHAEKQPAKQPTNDGKRPRARDQPANPTGQHRRSGRREAD